MLKSCTSDHEAPSVVPVRSAAHTLLSAARPSVSCGERI
eukprot:COSAG03_NODE_869_length_5567_cov_622.477601_6_plen_39_part_00